MRGRIVAVGFAVALVVARAFGRRPKKPRMVLMAARRCSRCSLNWPVLDAFKRCPVCEGRTWSAANAEPMTADEAKVAVREAQFERYYEKHDEEREGPTPEVEGAQEAREIIALERLWSLPAAER